LYIFVLFDYVIVVLQTESYDSHHEDGRLKENSEDKACIVLALRGALNGGVIKLLFLLGLRLDQGLDGLHKRVYVLRFALFGDAQVQMGACKCDYQIGG